MALRHANTHLPAPLPAFFALIDPARTTDPLALAAGLPTGAGVIYRHFGDADRVAVAARLRRMTARRGLVFLIGNDPRLAIQTGADGVHWPEARRNEARRWRSRFAIMTCAAHGRRGLIGAREASCDAALLSTVFTSKSDSASRPMGTLRFRSVVKGAPIPVYGLGGVNAQTFGQICSVAGGAAIEGASVFAR